MKTLITFTLIALSGFASIAAPHPGPRPIHRPPPYHVHYRPQVHHYHHHPGPAHHYHHHPGPAFVGGVVGGLLGAAVVEAIRPTIVTTPIHQPAVIVQSPTIVPRQVWVEGRYQQQVVNGTIVNVWVPGHWETIYR